MGKELTEAQKKALRRFQQEELDAKKMYEKMAEKVSSPKESSMFRHFAADAERHVRILEDLTDEILIADSAQDGMLGFLFSLMGKKRIFPQIAKGERDAAERYEVFLEPFPELEGIVEDKKRHAEQLESCL